MRYNAQLPFHALRRALDAELLVCNQAQLVDAHLILSFTLLSLCKAVKKLVLTDQLENKLSRLLLAHTQQRIIVCTLIPGTLQLRDSAERSVVRDSVSVRSSVAAGVNYCASSGCREQARISAAGVKKQVGCSRSSHGPQRRQHAG